MLDRNDKTKKREGFKGQKAISIPRSILTSHCAENSIITNLYITNIGYYPKAQYHFRQRPGGAGQHILIYCTDGKGYVQIGESSFTIEAGDVITIPQQIPHTYAADVNNPWTIYWIHFTGITASNIINKYTKNNGSKTSVKSLTKTIELFEEMYSRLERGYSTETLIYINMCVWHFLSTLLFNNDFVTGEVSGEKTMIEIVIDFFTKNLHKTITLHEVAQLVHLSPAHFSATFKSKTGVSPIEYFNQLKIQKACQYLHFTEVRIKQIAAELGIADHYYFSRLFTKVMGISPKAYRDQRTAHKDEILISI